jgi:hypothetical protein
MLSMKYKTYILRVISAGLPLLGAGGALRAEPKKIAMKAANWKTTGVVEFVQHHGVEAIELKARNRDMKMKGGEALPAVIMFKNGTIEFDIEPQGGMGAGIVFRKEQKNSGYFYLRPRPNCGEAPDCIQYAPQTRGCTAMEHVPAIPGAGVAARERMESHQDGNFRAADEYWRLPTISMVGGDPSSGRRE